MKRLIVVIFTLLSVLIMGCSSSPLIVSSPQEERPETHPYAKKEKVRELIVDLLPRSGRLGMTVGEIQSTGAIYVVKIIDQKKKGVVRNELIVRKDGAVMPVYGVRVNGEPSKQPVNSLEKARRLAAIWLWKTDNQNMRVGTAYQTHLAYVVTIHDAKEPNKPVSQIIVRKDGFLLPVSNGISLSPNSPRALGAGVASFGWTDPFFEPTFDTNWDSGEWWGSDWDTGWWGEDWGWGWGSIGNWTRPSDPPPDNGPCSGMTEEQCFCLQNCRNQCENAPPDHCFEDCVDICGLVS